MSESEANIVWDLFGPSVAELAAFTYEMPAIKAIQCRRWIDILKEWNLNSGKTR